MISTRLSKSSLSSIWTTCYSDGELRLVEVQVLIRSGLPRLDIIGLPENMIREGKDRILSALSHLGVELPTQKILVSLNPGDLAKEGSHFDLPILVAILTALGILLPKDGKSFCWGELGLDGSVRSVDDILAHILFANKFIPKELVSGGRPISMDFIRPYLCTPFTMINHVSDLLKIKPTSNHTTLGLGDRDILAAWKSQSTENSRWNTLQGTEDQFLFWALVALGRHHILLEGSQGVGKSSWCYAVNELQLPLPSSAWSDRFRYRQHLSIPMSELIDVFVAPFEAPHHGSSAASIIGGGSGGIQLGSVTRAHHGILFLDEFGEFASNVIESLREPLENKTITIARCGVFQTLSANVQLLAAMNPCKCGNYRSLKQCTCTQQQFYRYRTKISDPLKGRFHLICWWDFFPEARRKDFDLREVRERLVNAHLRRPPNLNGVILPTFKNPRKQRKWIEFFASWCKWFDISKPSTSDANQFNQFIQKLETTNDTHYTGTFSSDDGTRAREYGAAHS